MDSKPKALNPNGWQIVYHRCAIFTQGSTQNCRVLFYLSYKIKYKLLPVPLLQIRDIDSTESISV